MKKTNILLGLGTISVLSAFVFADANAAFTNRTAGSEETKAVVYSGEEYDLQGMSEMDAIATLQNDIAKLDNDIKECEKKRKGWIAATVIGGAGVVGTGVAAIVQGKKVKESKNELGELNSQLNTTKSEIKEKQTTLNDLNKGSN